ncbi:Delta(9)-fatty-acid desaturase fat-7 [Halotydeus destructor]|nr:Delta(9)-fatty-acid desaturase fat-7 [Halotydeus destructor]
MTAINLLSKEYQVSRFRYHIENGGMEVAKVNVVFFVFLYALASRTICKFLKFQISWQTLAFSLGMTAGAHRLWAHKSYKAKFALKVFLALGHTFIILLQNSVYVWARDHRVHHKWSDTDADPHNTQRGFFFAHSPPTCSETVKLAPGENTWVSIAILVEGYHNYHHKFPGDYQASEHGHGFNCITHFLNFMNIIGQAYDLNKTSNSVVDVCTKRWELNSVVVR